MLAGRSRPSQKAERAEADQANARQTNAGQANARQTEAGLAKKLSGLGHIGDDRYAEWAARLAIAAGAASVPALW